MHLIRGDGVPVSDHETGLNWCPCWGLGGCFLEGERNFNYMFNFFRIILSNQLSLFICASLLLLFSCQLCLTLCDSMDCSMPDFPVLHYLSEFAQTHVCWVSDAIQSSHPLSSPFSSCPQSCPASGSFPVSRLFASRGQSIGASASILPMNIQDWFPLEFTGDRVDLLVVQGTLQSLLQHHSLKASVLWCSTLSSNSYMRTWLLEKTQLWLYGPLLAEWYLQFLICCLDLS